MPLTTWGAFFGGFSGLIGAVVLTVLSPGIWTSILGYSASTAPFPFASPAIFTMPLSLLVCFVVSKLDSYRTAKNEREAFEAQYIHSQTRYWCGGSSRTLDPRDGGGQDRGPAGTNSSIG